MRPVSESAFFELSLKDVKPWSFDKPNTGLCLPVDPDGENRILKPAMSASERYHRKQCHQIKQQADYIQGVNRHEHFG